MGYDNCQNCGIGVSLDGTGPEFCAHCAPVSASAGPGASPSPGSRCQTLMGPGCFGNLCGPCDSDYAALLDRLAAAERRAEEAEENPGRVWHEWRKRVERVFTVFAHEVMPIAEADDHRKDPEVVLPYLEAWFERLNEAENALASERAARERAERERDEAREEIARHPRRCTVDNKCEPCRSEERAWEQADAAEARAEKAESSLSRAVEALLALKKEASWLGASHPHLAHYYYINGATWDQIKAVLAEVGK